MARNEETLQADSRATIRGAAHLTRRSFIKATTAATALAAASSLTACAPATSDLAATGDDAEATHPAGRDIVSGEWKTAACWHNCGGRCLNKVLVQDGVVVRQKTDDTHEDSPDYPQQRGCIRGRSQRKQVFAEDRLKYPMKRKSWQPGGGEASNGALRGKDEWERISWDEAFSLCAEEMNRIKEAYGNRAFFLDSWTMSTEYKRLMGAFGGFIDAWGTCSLGNYTLPCTHIGFGAPGGMTTTGNDRFDWVNSELVVLLGGNPAWSSFGMPANILRTAKDAGAQFISIDPVYNETAALVDADWIPTRPGSDTALLLGVAHSLLAQDEAEHLIDWDFLEKTSIGYDADHMPAGVDGSESFFDYLRGTKDGVEKDAAWASTHCGVDPERIMQLAREIGKDRKVVLSCGWAPARTNNSDSLPQLFMTIGAMTGHMGKPGHQTCVGTEQAWGNHGPALVRAGGTGLDPIPNPCDDFVSDPQAWTMVLGEPYNYTGQSNDGIECKPCEMRTADIHMIFHGSAASMQSRQGILKGIEAHRKVDFVLACTTFFTNSAKYADIVLPVNTEWERPGGFVSGNREQLIMYQQVCDSQFESQDDQWIVAKLGAALGLDEKVLYPFDRKQQFFNQAVGAELAVDGTGENYEPLFTITQEDIDRWGVQGTPQEGVVALSEVEQSGLYQVKRSANDNFGHISFKEFVENPEANPNPYSPSGKFEIYSKSYAETANGMGYVDNITPIPTFIEPLQGYEQTFSDFEAGVKGDYPFQMVTIHYMGRSHTTFGNIAQIQEAFTSPVFINAADANELGIQSGDTVKITTDTASSLRTATVTQCIMPGVIAITHGSWSDFDEETGLDSAGSDNILMGTQTTGQGTSGFNTIIVNIEKVDTELVPDCEKPRRIVEI